MGVGVDKLLLCPLVKRKIHRAVAIEWTDITNSALCLTVVRRKVIC